MLSPGGIDVAELTENQARVYDRSRVDKQIKWLADLGTTLRSVGGRKQVVLFSEGCDASLVQGRDMRDQAGQQQDIDNIVGGNLAKVDSDRVFGSATQLTNLARLERAYRGSDVVLSAIDIRGVRGLGDAPGMVGQS